MVQPQILKRLDASHIDYKLITHSPVYTCEEAARSTKSKPREHLKTMLLMDMNDSPAFALLPGDRRLNLRKAAKALGVRELRLAIPKEVKDILDVEIGAVSVLLAEDIPALLDIEVIRNKLVYLSAGTHTESIVINPRDLQRIVKAKLTSLID